MYMKYSRILHISDWYLHDDDGQQSDSKVSFLKYGTLKSDREINKNYNVNHTVNYYLKI